MIPMKDMNPSISLRIDGKESIEQQLDIHVSDMQELEGPNPPVSITMKDLIAGIRYVMTYRIKNGRMRHLDLELCKRLCRALLQRMAEVNGRFLIGKRPTDEANEAFYLFGEFLEEVIEFRIAVGETCSVHDLKQSLLLHLRLSTEFQGESVFAAPNDNEAEDKKLHEAALAILSMLITWYPLFGDWRELIKGDYQKSLEPVVNDLIFHLGGRSLSEEQMTAALASETAGSIGSSGVKRHNSVFLRVARKMPKLDDKTIMPPPALHVHRDTTKVCAMFKSDPVLGLSADQLKELTGYYGKNEIPQPKAASVLKMIWSQLSDPMVMVLLIVAIFAVSVDSHEYPSTIFLLIVIIMNVSIGFFQEQKAKRALDALVKLSVPTAKVIRDGQKFEILSQNLVPGDLVQLEEGDSVPADLRLLECANLEVMEAILTGESIAVTKKPDPIRTKARALPLGDCSGNAFMSTLVVRGRAIGVVVRTGKDTAIGKISLAITSAPEILTPIQKKLKRLGFTLVGLAILLCALVAIIGYVKTNDWKKAVISSVVLAVSVIPEGLVAIVTVTMALAVSRMAKRSAIVRSLPSVETLGSVTVICSDKTGTLTEGKMSVRQLWTSDEISYFVDGNVGGCQMQALGSEIAPMRIESSLHFVKAMSICNLCNNATFNSETKEYMGDPTEIAIYKSTIDLATYHDGGSEGNTIIRSQKRVREIAFDSDRKMMTIITTKKETECDKGFVLSKGAPESVLPCCKTFLNASNEEEELTDTFMSIISKQNDVMGGLGLRVLALAMRSKGPKEEEKDLDDEELEEKIERDFTFIGLVGMIDPPRKTVQKSIAMCRKAGIRVIMITGDHLKTAVAIATDLGIFDSNDSMRSRAMRGIELDTLTTETLSNLNPFPCVFARVSPENKLSIVTALQEKQHVVAMTGDGINDAPAIKRADVGVAMGKSGTEITKQAADIILSDDDFSTIVMAVEEGRRVFDNINKFIVYLLSCNSAEIWVVLVAVAVKGKSPFTPINILWANIIADIPPSMSLGLEPTESDVMERQPRSPTMGVINLASFLNILIMGLVVSGLSLIVYFVPMDGTRFKTPEAESKYRGNETFAILTTMQFILAFTCRSTRSSIFVTGITGNLYMVGAIILSFALLFLGHYVPGLNTLLQLEPLQSAFYAKAAVCIVIVLVASEVMKLALRHLESKNSTKKEQE